MEGRALLPRRAGSGSSPWRDRSAKAECRWRRHRARPPGGRLGNPDRAPPSQNAPAEQREARHRLHLHRRWTRRGHAGRNRLVDRLNTGTRHWHWETDRDGLAWLTFDKQGESANTFSREALEELGRALTAIRLENPKGL